MPSRVIRTPDDLQAATALIATVKLPLTLEWHQGVNRTKQQNRLLHKWFGEIAEQRGDMTAIQVKAEAKGFHGVAMMRAESDYFRERYDAATAGRTMEQKLQILEIWPLTSLMSVPQMTRFMDDVSADYSAKGFRLTQPDDDLVNWMEGKR